MRQKRVLFIAAQHAGDEFLPGKHRVPDMHLRFSVIHRNACDHAILCGIDARRRFIAGRRKFGDRFRLFQGHKQRNAIELRARPGDPRIGLHQRAAQL